MKQMANDVAARRKSLAMSQRALCATADIAQATLVKIEANDGYAPSGTVQVKIATALGAETHELFWSEEVDVPAEVA